MVQVASRASALALPPLTVAVQAGGESRRMGRSKATVPFMGRPLIERLVDRVAPLADEILITTNEPENLGFLSRNPNHEKVRLVRDIRSVRGSLSGMLTAFDAASNEFVAACACDMMFVSPELFLAEFMLLGQDECVDAVVPRTEFGFEPFHGVYRRGACLRAVDRALGEGISSLRGFLGLVRTRALTIDEVSQVVPEGRCFMNANTPDELAKAEAVAREVERGGQS